MVPLQIPGGLGAPELVIALVILLLVVGVPVLVLLVVAVPLVRGYRGDQDAPTNRDEVTDLRERVSELEAEVERLRETDESEASADDREQSP